MKDRYSVAIAVGVASGVQYAQSGNLWHTALAGMIAAVWALCLLRIFKED